MRFASDFTVPAAPGRTYELLLDVERVAPCFPGGEVGAAAPDGTYPAKVTVRLGPIRLAYEGTVRVAERDDEQRRAVLVAKAREVRGQGSAEARMTMEVAGQAAAAPAQVHIDTELNLTGRAAQMGGGVVQEVARRLVAEMADCLARRVEPEPPGTTAGGPHASAPTPAAADRRQLRAGAIVARALWMRLQHLVKGGRHA